MKFSDIDFSAISRMMDNMSDEEKNKLNDMAKEMYNFTLIDSLAFHNKHFVT